MSAGIMLIPAMTPPLDETAHLTLVYGGDDPEYFKIGQMRAMAQQLSWVYEPFVARTWGLTFFGKSQNEPVIRVVNTGEIGAMRSVVAQFHESEYPFDPHVAIPQVTNRLPKILYFNKIALWVDNDHSAEWWLGSR